MEKNEITGQKGSHNRTKGIINRTKGIINRYVMPVMS